MGFNLFLVVYHILMFFIATMGFGGSSERGTLEFWVTFLLFTLTGGAPNYFVFLIAVLFKRDPVTHAIWATIFFFLVFVAYVCYYATILF
ncbi:hypothetical protein ACQKJC_00600 [Priestia koreensis]|uniref:hypothetical protein n=1 Tax=Priestia koreensis TaxID=284581 RepID=UPI003D03F557